MSIIFHDKVKDTPINNLPLHNQLISTALTYQVPATIYNSIF